MGFSRQEYCSGAFSYLEPVYCSMSSSNCCFLSCIQISHEADQVVWYSHLFQNFPQFIVIHTVKGFGPVWQALAGHKRSFPLAVVLPPPARGAGTLIPSAQRLVWAAKQPLGNAALGALFA